MTTLDRLLSLDFLLGPTADQTEIMARCAISASLIATLIMLIIGDPWRAAGALGCGAIPACYLLGRRLRKAIAWAIAILIGFAYAILYITIWAWRWAKSWRWMPGTWRDRWENWLNEVVE